MVGWRKTIRVLHRDLGYFFFGMILIYAVSGGFLNHIRDWNSNYEISAEPVAVEWKRRGSLSEDEVRSLLGQMGETGKLKSYYTPVPGRLKIFFEGGSVELDTETGQGTVERLERRPVLFELNFLHYNPGAFWKYFSDVFCVSLLVIAVTGMLVLRGKRGIKGRGAWLGGLGIVVPALFLLYYLWGGE